MVDSGAKLLLACLRPISRRVKEYEGVKKKSRQDARSRRLQSSPLRNSWTPTGPPPSAEVARRAIASPKADNISADPFKIPPGWFAGPTLPTFFELLWTHLHLVHPTVSAIKYGDWRYRSLKTHQKKLRQDWLKILACGCVLPLEYLWGMGQVHQKIDEQDFLSMTCPGEGCNTVLCEPIRTQALETVRTKGIGYER